MLNNLKIDTTSCILLKFDSAILQKNEKEILILTSVGRIQSQFDFIVVLKSYVSYEDSLWADKSFDTQSNSIPSI